MNKANKITLNLKITKRNFVMKIVIITTVFLMLLLAVLYTALCISHNIKTNSETDHLNASKSEKLINKHQFTVQKQIIEALPARPFINELRGEHPSGFSSSSLATTNPTYTQNHENPNNIHDVTEYLNKNAHKEKELTYQQQQEQYNTATIKNKYLSQDPFFAFKPQDPGDINLLAPNSFRFAPVIVHSKYQKNRQDIKEAESVVANRSMPFLRKPLKLTLNIYPTPFFNSWENEELGFQGPGVTPRYKHTYVAPWAKNEYPPEKIVVHLSVYPNLNRINKHPYENYHQIN
ncbi:hypothetical protein RN001_012157 [Aquatica leii]|uniref:Uncharacterized protein n=1 Tax=Aquatica leii TaxID=1421715 RepID=A0AAN7Q1C7_9COLE|nr:hypothetical protein RN001_012157 [Aquatica leii]